MFGSESKQTKLYNAGVKAFSLGEEYFDAFSGTKINNYSGLYFFGGKIDSIMELKIIDGERCHSVVSKSDKRIAHI